MINVNRLVGEGLVSLDTETFGLGYPNNEAFAIAIVGLGARVYVDLRHHGDPGRRLVQDVLDRAKTIASHNALFDASALALAGFNVPLAKFDCTIVRACLLNEHESTIFPWSRKAPGSYSLDYLANKYLGKGKLSIDVENIADLPLEEAAKYAVNDADLALGLWLYQQEKAAEDGVLEIMAFERRFFPTLARAYMRGVRVDIDAAERAMTKLTPLINRRQKALDKLAGFNVNVNSGPQMIKLFEPKYENGAWRVGDVRIGTTGKGAPSLKAEFLRSLADHDERAEMVESIRSLIKTRDTFLAKHIIEHSVNGRVYPTINQTANENGGTRTGRLSYVDPALQQIPSRDKEAASIVKPCFLPEYGHIWSDNDMHSFEVRIFVSLAGMYNRGLPAKIYGDDPKRDLHQYVADLTGLPRNPPKSGAPNAKQLNLSMIFSQGAGATAYKMGMKCEDAEFTDNFDNVIKYKRPPDDIWPILDRYHAALPGVKKLAEISKQRAEGRGYVQTPYGRKLRFFKRYKSYKASGLLIQATSADLNKENWMLIEEALGDRGSIIMNTHDSYGLSLDPGKKDACQEDVRRAVEREFLGVPLILDHSGYGRNWWDAIKE
jgi:DNA polymerase I-like protein with 3'-5' exonuclease and polymerase domains